jgi:hypothetical protein
VSARPEVASAVDDAPQTETASIVEQIEPEPPANNFAKLPEVWKLCTPEERLQLLIQNNAGILTGSEGLLLIRGYHVAALRDSDRQTRIRELRALLTAFNLTAHDLFPPAAAARPASPDERKAGAHLAMESSVLPGTVDPFEIPGFMRRLPADAAESGNGEAA